MSMKGKKEEKEGREGREEAQANLLWFLVMPPKAINKDFWTHQMLNLLTTMVESKVILFLYSFSFQVLLHFFL